MSTHVLKVILHTADGLSACFLREVAVEIVVLFTHLYNMSLHQGIVLQAWKQSHITPIHKGGPTDDPSNYRPISVVCMVAKILEKIVSTGQLSSYLEDYQLLHPYQGAYIIMVKVHLRSDILVAVDTIVHHLDEG